METIYIGGAITGIIVILIGTIHTSQSRRIAKMDDATRAIGNKMDNKINKEICEEHRRHQTEVNINIIERLTRIETKIDILTNGNKKGG